MSETKTPAEWQAITGITILDPDGWRMDGKNFDEPISQDEWEHRMGISTVSFNKQVSQQEQSS